MGATKVRGTTPPHIDNRVEAQESIGQRGGMSTPPARDRARGLPQRHAALRQPAEPRFTTVHSTSISEQRDSSPGARTSRNSSGFTTLRAGIPPVIPNRDMAFSELVAVFSVTPFSPLVDALTSHYTTGFGVVGGVLCPAPPLRRFGRRRKPVQCHVCGARQPRRWFVARPRPGGYLASASGSGAGARFCSWPRFRNRHARCAAAHFVDGRRFDHRLVSPTRDASARLASPRTEAYSDLVPATQSLSRDIHFAARNHPPRASARERAQRRFRGRGTSAPGARRPPSARRLSRPQALPRGLHGPLLVIDFAFSLQGAIPPASQLLE